MIRLAEKIMRTTVPQNHVAVFFMGQAGIILKDSKGTLVAIDLYLSDCCERYFGFKRLMPKILDASDIEFDIIITTHAHYDHFDIDAMPFLMENYKSKLYTALDGKELCEQLNLPMDRVKFIECGNAYMEKDIKIQAVYCDHGELAPYAVGLVLTVEGKTIYITGDTALRIEKIVDIASRQIDLMVAPINGAFGKCCWCGDGVRPVVPCQRIREYTYAYGAVSPLDGEMVSLVLPYCNTECMNIFLETLSKTYPNDYILLVADNAGWHKFKTLVMPVNIEVFPLLPYTPELNPIEMIWDELREKFFVNEIFKTLKLVTDILCDGLLHLSAHTDTVKSITGWHWILTDILKTN